AHISAAQNQVSLQSHGGEGAASMCPDLVVHLLLLRLVALSPAAFTRDRSCALGISSLPASCPASPGTAPLLFLAVPSVPLGSGSKVRDASGIGRETVVRRGEEPAPSDPGFSSSM
ncbi:UNVERIFIED_CONTAM: hypothetical protein K2H54_074163, partial [Gekko kuhli]